MIGNDIIDLSLCRKESNWNRKGWLEKLFSNDERINIKESRNPEMLVWLYWSMKEAAYKIYNRQHNKRIFEPAKLLCVLEELTDNDAAGHVHYRGSEYATKSILNHLFIHTVACADNIYPSGNCISNNKLQPGFCKNFEFKKNEEGFPFLIHKKTSKTFIASKSHHGLFEAIVF